MPVTFKKIVGFTLLIATIGLLSWQALFAV